jgi:hypothetical protein
VSRTPHRPDSGLRTPSQLRRELVTLHVWAGRPGARRLTTTAADLGLTLARSTTQDLISGARVAGLPGRDFVRAFVMACLTHSGAEDVESEAELWDQAWLAVVQAHGQVPATSTTERTPPRQSPHRVIFVSAAVIAVLVAAAVTMFVVTGSDDEPTEAAVSTAAIQDVYCARDGLTASWQNHHSQLYLAVPEAKAGNTVEALPGPHSSPTTTFAVARQEDAGTDGCAHRLTLGGVCLAAPGDATADVVQAECADRPDQLWLIENHWYHEGVMWQRLRPAHRTDLCLQQQNSEEGLSILAVLKPCGTNWIQQWRLQPADT